MTYKHGVGRTELPTSIGTPVQVSAGLQVVVGTAPIHLAKSNEYVNKPLLAYSHPEAVKGLGYSNDWKNYTLCEVIDTAFSLYAVAPVVFINVLDPEKHKAEVAQKELPILSKKIVIKDAVLLDTLVVKGTETGADLKKNEDYTATFDDDGNAVITVIPTGSIGSNQSLFAAYTKVDPSKVTELDIIGGVDIDTGQATGLELINSVFPKFGLVPGSVLAPKFSRNPMVEAVMKAKANNINSYFKAMALTDIDASEVNTYSKVSEWKNQNNYTSENEIACWPMQGLGTKKYHMSSQVASLMNLVDSQHQDIPYRSPSNKSFQMNKSILEDGTEIHLGPDEANYLNGQGILTALNWIGGWKAWGNRTGAYPANTDPKDSFIPVRRTHNWIGNTVILTHWQKVDDPTNRRQIDTVVDGMNIWLNGLTALGAIVGGRLEFRREENPLTDLTNGWTRYHLFVAESTPNEYMEFILEFDATYYNRLFE